MNPGLPSGRVPAGAGLPALAVRAARHAADRGAERVAVVGLVDRQVRERHDAVDRRLGRGAAERRAIWVGRQRDRDRRRDVDDVAGAVHDLNGDRRSPGSERGAGDRLGDERVGRLGHELQRAAQRGRQAAACGLERQLLAPSLPSNACELQVGSEAGHPVGAVAVTDTCSVDPGANQRPLRTTVFDCSVAVPCAPAGSDAAVTVNPTGGFSVAALSHESGSEVLVRGVGQRCWSARRRTSSSCRPAPPRERPRPCTCPGRGSAGQCRRGRRHQRRACERCRHGQNTSKLHDVSPSSDQAHGCPPLRPIRRDPTKPSHGRARIRRFLRRIAAPRPLLG
jgi:hypothetical protein